MFKVTLLKCYEKWLYSKAREYNTSLKERATLGTSTTVTLGEDTRPDRSAELEETTGGLTLLLKGVLL